LASDCSKVCAVPWKLPWIVAGMPISFTARVIAVCASLKDFPGATLNEIVVATKVPWWLTASGVLPGP
jgi:hypothetical protein